MILKHVIEDNRLWGNTSKSFGISPEGRRVAVRSTAWGLPDGAPNVFVYSTNGDLVQLLQTSASLEFGIGFWQHTSQVLVPGAREPSNWDAFGLKCWNLASKTLYLPFARTPLNKVGVNLLGVSPSYRYIVGHYEAEFHDKEQGIWCIDSSTMASVKPIVDKWPHIDDGTHRAIFSPDEQLVAVIIGNDLVGVRESIVFETATGAVLWRSGRQADRVALAFDATSRNLFLVAKEPGRAVLEQWNLNSRSVVNARPLDEQIVRVNSGCYIPSTDQVAAGCLLRHRAALATSVILIEPHSLAVTDQHTLASDCEFQDRVTAVQPGQDEMLIAAQLLRRDTPLGTVNRGQIAVLQLDGR